MWCLGCRLTCFAAADLDVRDLLRRDWKGDVVRSSDSTEENPGRGVHLGFASCPTVGLLDMVERTESKTIDEFFEYVYSVLFRRRAALTLGDRIESAFTQEISTLDDCVQDVDSS